MRVQSQTTRTSAARIPLPIRSTCYVGNSLMCFGIYSRETIHCCKASPPGGTFHECRQTLRTEWTGHTMDANVFRCIKYVMCIFNLIIFLGGTGLITLGAWISANPRSFREVVGVPPPSLMGAGGYVAVGLGFLLAVLGFLGCCGAARESKVLLLAFFVCVLFFFVVEVVATVVMLILKGRLTEEFFRNQLRRRYVGDNGTDIFNRAWNTIMATLQCCGASGPADFAHDSRFLRTAGGRVVPNACCTQLSGGAINIARCLRLEPGFFHRQGCYIALGKTLRASQSLVGGVGAAILTTEVLAMASAMCLLHGMN